MAYFFRWISSIFLCFCYIPFCIAKPVVPGQSQWCVTKQIASSTDAIESKVELLNLDISATEGFLFSELALLNTDVAIVSSKADVVESLANLLDSCQATPFTASTTISISGYYCLSATNIVGVITVQSATNNVVVDLNGHRVQGVVVNSNDQITFRNGTIDGSNMTGVGLDVLSGATNITLQYLDVQNAQIGIRMTGVSGAIVENCSMSLNFTGIQLNQSNEILIDKSVATANQHAGFDLVSSITCTLLNSKAIATGQGNTQTANAIICGFVTSNGDGNIFENCIADGTQGLTITDFDSLVAGFAFRGTEACSKIINCESANASTSSSGFNVPYGILLEGTFNTQLTLTGIPPVPVPAGTINAVVWSPDGKYVATGGADNTLSVYEFNRIEGTFFHVAVASVGDAIHSIDWHPDGEYIAIGIPNFIEIYLFIRANNTLTMAASSAANGLVDLAWSPSGLFLAISQVAPDRIAAYSFNAVAQTIAILGSATAVSSYNIYNIDWSPDGNYLAVMIAGAYDTLDVYSFTQSNATPFAFNVSANVVTGAAINFDVSWSPDGKYIATANNAADGSTLTVFAFTPGNLTLRATHGYSFLGSQQYAIVEWSDDSRYLVTTDIDVYETSYIQFFEFNRSALSLIQVGNSVAVPSGIGEPLRSLDWSPDGGFVAFGTSASYYLGLCTAITFPSKNVIKNNTVYCNSGSDPLGIGISGSSIANMIIQNTAYSNPINPFMVDTSYAFVQNVFNQNFGQGPTLLQNIAVGDRQVIQQPVDLALLARQIYSSLLTVTGAITTISCSPTTITNSNVVAGTISLTQSGNYCLGSAVTGDIAITGTSVALNLNGNCVSGDIIISGDDAYVYNGNVIPVAVATTGSINAGIDILALTNRAMISNVVVDASTQPTAANTGRPALRTAGIDTQIYNCTLTGGPALNATGSANGTNGGSGIILTGSATRTIIQNCTISGNDGGNGGTTSTFGNGGNGGHGVEIQVGSVSIAEITNCLIVATGVGGAAGTANGTRTGGRGGDGVSIDASAAGIAVHNCIIRNAGAAGLSATQTLVTAIDMMGMAPNISVIDNAAGKAVNDLVTATPNLSVIFANFADTITNPIVYNLNNRQATPGTDPTNGDGGVLVPNPPDATAGGGNVIVNHIVNVFMSVLSS